MECQHNQAALADQPAPIAQLIRNLPSVKSGVKGQSHMAGAAASDRRRSRPGAASSDAGWPVPAPAARRVPLKASHAGCLALETLRQSGPGDMQPAGHSAYLRCAA